MSTGAMQYSPSTNGMISSTACTVDAEMSVYTAGTSSSVTLYVGVADRLDPLMVIRDVAQSTDIEVIGIVDLLSS